MSFLFNDFSTLSEDLFREACQKVIRKSSSLNPWQWCEENIVLSSQSSANPGPYDASYTPAWKWVMEKFADPYVRQLSVMKSVQCGGTQWMINTMLYAVKHLGLPVLYVGQTENDVKKFIKRKYDPVEQECIEVRELKVPGNTAWNEREYTTCHVAIGWGSSTNVLASASIGLLALDEVDKYKMKDKNEPHPFDAAVKRVTSFPDTHKILVTSTPSIPTGVINREYLKGSMHVGKLPCPQCGEFHEWKFTQETFVWPEECRDEDGNYDLNLVREHARYQCPTCSEKIDEVTRLDMLQGIEYFQTNMKAPKEHISVHMPCFYSPFVSIGEVSTWFLKSKDTANGLRDLHTQAFAIPFQAKTVANNEDTIKSLQKRTPIKYARAKRNNFKKEGKRFTPYELPFEPLFISTTVDVQGDCFWIMQCAFDLNGHMAILDWDKVFGYQEILAWGNRIYTHEGKKFTSRFNLIDAGYQMKAAGGVYDFVIHSRGKFLPCLGRKNSYFEIIQTKNVSFRGRDFEQYSFQDPTFKELLYQHRMRNKGSKQVWLPKVIDNELINQLTDEQLVEVETPDGTAMEWETKEKNNHLGDCAKMHLVIWEKMGATLIQDREEAQEVSKKR